MGQEEKERQRFIKITDKFFCEILPLLIVPVGKKHFSVMLLHKEQAYPCSSSYTVIEIPKPDAVEEILPWTVLNKMFGGGFFVTESSLWVPRVLKHQGVYPNFRRYCY